MNKTMKMTTCFLLLFLIPASLFADWKNEEINGMNDFSYSGTCIYRNKDKYSTAVDFDYTMHVKINRNLMPTIYFCPKGSIADNLAYLEIEDPGMKRSMMMHISQGSGCMTGRPAFDFLNAMAGLREPHCRFTTVNGGTYEFLFVKNELFHQLHTASMKHSFSDIEWNARYVPDTALTFWSQYDKNAPRLYAVQYTAYITDSSQTDFIRSSFILSRSRDSRLLRMRNMIYNPNEATNADLLKIHFIPRKGERPTGTVITLIKAHEAEDFAVSENDYFSLLNELNRSSKIVFSFSYINEGTARQADFYMKSEEFASAMALVW